MICRRGGIPDFVKVMDFGLVKHIGTSQGRDQPEDITQSTATAAFERIVLRCLEKDPRRRFDSATALLAALRSVPDAGVWSDEDAQAWWRARGDALVQALRAEQTARAGGAGAPGAV